MSIHNLYRYSQVKTIKLSDTYTVDIRLTDDDKNIISHVFGSSLIYLSDRYISLPQCVSVKLPDLPMKSEVYHYGNNTRMFLIPDLSKPDDLSIEVIETYLPTNKISEMGTSCGLCSLLVNLFLNKLFDSTDFTYKLTDYIPELKVSIYKNDFTGIIYEYIFKELKLTSYNKYTLDYSSNNLCKYVLNFSYRSYEQITNNTTVTIDEAISAVHEKLGVDPQDINKDAIVETAKTEEPQVTTSSTPVVTPNNNPMKVSIKNSIAKDDKEYAEQLKNADNSSIALAQQVIKKGWDKVDKSKYTDEQIINARNLLSYNSKKWDEINKEAKDRNLTPPTVSRTQSSSTSKLSKSSKSSATSKPANPPKPSTPPATATQPAGGINYTADFTTPSMPGTPSTPTNLASPFNTYENDTEIILDNIDI